MFAGAERCSTRCRMYMRAQAEKTQERFCGGPLAGVMRCSHETQ